MTFQLLATPVLPLTRKYSTRCCTLCLSSAIAAVQRPFLLPNGKPRAKPSFRTYVASLCKTLRVKSSSCSRMIHNAMCPYHSCRVPPRIRKYRSLNIPSNPSCSYAFVEFRSTRDAEDAYYDMYAPSVSRHCMLFTQVGLHRHGRSFEGARISIQVSPPLFADDYILTIPS